MTAKKNKVNREDQRLLEHFQRQLITHTSQGMLGISVFGVLLGALLFWFMWQIKSDIESYWLIDLLVYLTGLNWLFALISSVGAILPRIQRWLAKQQVFATWWAALASFSFSLFIAELFLLLWVGESSAFQQTNLVILGICVLVIVYIGSLVYQSLRLHQAMKHFRETNEMQLALLLAGVTFLAVLIGSFFFGFLRSFSFFMGMYFVWLMARLTVEVSYLAYLKQRFPIFWEKFSFKKSVEKENFELAHEFFSVMINLSKVVLYLCCYLFIIGGIIFYFFDLYAGLNNWQEVASWIALILWALYGIFWLMKFSKK